MDKQTEKKSRLSEFLEAGIIVNTHGLQGEVKILPWADSPDFLAGIKHVFIDGAKVEMLSARVHKGMVIALLEGVSDIDDAIKMKRKIVHISREDAHLEDGRYFITDIVGLRVIDADSGDDIGTVSDVLSLPANNVYIVKGVREILIPAVPEFIIETDIDEGFVKVRLIEGM